MSRRSYRIRCRAKPVCLEISLHVRTICPSGQYNGWFGWKGKFSKTIKRKTENRKQKTENIKRKQKHENRKKGEEEYWGGQKRPLLSSMVLLLHLASFFHGLASIHNLFDVEEEGKRAAKRQERK
ncbi:hypothetical protein Cni_G06771 [Canna indica]|uniref:Uncharacterized protein n=1 Tax=Canna indica TaxID=4628 RepID=A0AAQ3JXW6_9LILI|nr:hypothetical protein Cni_G06771 [Canna indica]